MRRTSYQQFAIVQGDSAQQLTERLNLKLYELRDKEPTVTFEGLIARISYMQEDFEEEQKQEKHGLNLMCRDCPMFEPTLKRDGTEDKRTEIGTCRFATDGYTTKRSTACDRLYQMMNEREVKICFRED